MDGRRLVDAAGDRFEIADVEDERPQVTIPTDDVQRMVLEVVSRQPTTRPDPHDEVARLIVRCSLIRYADIAVGIRRVLEQLAPFVAIALGWDDLRWRLDVQDSVV